MIESFTEEKKRKKRWADDDYDEDMWDMGDNFKEGFVKADYSVGQTHIVRK